MLIVFRNVVTQIELNPLLSLMFYEYALTQPLTPSCIFRELSFKLSTSLIRHLISMLCVQCFVICLFRVISLLHVATFQLNALVTDFVHPSAKFLFVYKGSCKSPRTLCVKGSYKNHQFTKIPSSFNCQSSS